MRILAVEFSSEQRSVAVASAAELSAGSHRPLRSISVLGTAQDVGGRSVKALTMVETALAQAKTPREEIECIALGLGPGSYAGIRAAISLAQGWQLAHNVRLVGISSVEGLAFDAQSSGVRGEITFLIDAQRNEYYVAGYSITEDDRRVIEPLHIVPHAEVMERTGRGQRFMGPDRVAGVEIQLVYPQAEALAKLAASSSEFVSGEQLEPIYLREARFVKAPPGRVVEG